jgi:choline-sulfatase
MILVTIDTLRADRITPALTPHLARLQQEGATFTQAITAAPLTLPSHASLLSALDPPRHGVRDNQVFSLSPDVLTFPRALQSQGYATAAFVSAVVLNRRFGLNSGFDVYDDEMSGPERPGADTLARARAWLSSAREPFFLWVHLFEPHAPYAAGSYDGEVTATDGLVGQFFGFLRERGLWDRVVISVTSDHGESLGEHGEATHGFFVYDATLRIPWLLKAPGLAAGRYPHQVRIVDVLPTMAALAGATGPIRPASDAIDGVALDRYLRSGASAGLDAYSESWLPRHQFGWSSLASLRSASWKYIQAPRPELYEVRADPGETNNRVSIEPDESRRLASLLNAIAQRPGPSVAANVDLLEAEKFLALGYIGASGPRPAPGIELPDPKDKLEIYGLTMEAVELSEGGNSEGALARLDRANRLDPAVAQVHYTRGAILGGLGRYAEAARALERTLELSPRHVAARFKLALALVRLQDYRGAKAQLEYVLRDEPRNFRAYHNLAAIAYTEGDLGKAATLERQALAIDPNYFEAWNTVGAIHLRRREVDAAVGALERATRLNPASAQAQQNLALAYRAAGRGDKAAQAMGRACALDRRYCATAAQQ